MERVKGSGNNTVSATMCALRGLRDFEFVRTIKRNPAKSIAVLPEPPRRRTTVPRQTHGRHGKHPSELVLRLSESVYTVWKLSKRRCCHSVKSLARRYAMLAWEPVLCS